MKAIEQCQQWCASEIDCAHWTMQYQQRLCRLAGTTARKLTSAISSVSGAKASCNDKELLQVEDADDSSGGIINQAALPHGISTPHYAPFLVLSAALVVGMVSTV